MTMTRFASALLLIALAAGLTAGDDQKPKMTPKEALQPFNDLIGPWRANGEPEGSAQDKQRGLWKEKVAWSWKFKGDDCWLTLTISNGKYFKSGELHYVPEKDQYELRMVTKDNKTQTFAGKLDEKGRSLAAERFDEDKKESQRLTIDLVGDIRFVYRYDYKPEGRKQFVKNYRVSATKEGESLASSGPKKPECVVSGGLGTMTVSHNGQTYYVCCTGCLEAFKENPTKYIKEYEAKKAKEAKEGKD